MSGRCCKVGRRPVVVFAQNYNFSGLQVNNSFGFKTLSDTWCAVVAGYCIFRDFKYQAKVANISRAHVYRER